MRKEKDSMGEMELPDEALYGATTQRAVLNFPISNLRFSENFIRALGAIKYSAAESNKKKGDLEGEKADAIQKAALEVYEGKLSKHFVVDIFQTGSGTSTNMNANEVIANRAVELLGGTRGDKSLVHPNDHVNMAQSSNDVIPTAMHIAAAFGMKPLKKSLDVLATSLEKKAKEFARVVKSGRTHLQDATPVTLGQEFAGYAHQMRAGIERLERAESSVCELALGGTAVGTGLNTYKEFVPQSLQALRKLTGMTFTEARDHFEAQGAQDGIVELSGALKVIACSLTKIANDIRWLAAGPRCALGEINLAPVQPGSSIMPGKVNPVICESVLMVAAQVIGNDSCVTLCGQAGNFELNTMLPVMAHNVLESLEILDASCRNLATRCIDGIEVNEAQCLEYAEQSLAICTSLAPILGYDKAAELAKHAFTEGLTIRELVEREGLLSKEELIKALDLLGMTRPE